MMNQRTKLIAATATAGTLLAGSEVTAQGSLVVDFQATIASEQHPSYSGEARYYHVSINPSNPGIGSYAATAVGTNSPAAPFVRPFDQDVVAYKWIGGTNNNISGVTVTGGEDNRIVYATQDTVFDGFGQSQLKFWDVTDPGSNLQTTVADPFNAVDDRGDTGGYRSFGGATGTIDVSGLFGGSFYLFYGAFNATPSVSAVLKDTEGVAPDIVITNAHLNGDQANRTEYYVAEFDFVTGGVYDTLEFEHLANGSDYSGNGRGLGSLLTGSTGPPAELSIEVNTVTGAMTLLGDDTEAITINYYEITSAGDSLDATGWNSLADQDYEGNGPANGSGNGWEEGGGSGAQALAEAYLLGDSAIPGGAQIGLGTAYDTTVDAQDLVFRYRTDTGRQVEGSIQYIATGPAADLSGDGDVDDEDLGLFFSAFTGPDNGPSLDPRADLSGDGDVDDEDLGIAFSEFTGPLSPVNVPEPSSLLTAALGGLALLRRRR